MNLQKLYNPMVLALLRSPLHGLISGSTMAVTVTGRRSGRRYSTPVGYVRDGSGLLAISSPDRTWWRNLRGGAPVRLRVQGREVAATGCVDEDADAVSAGLVRIARRNPRYGTYLGVTFDDEGQVADPDALRRAASARVVVRFEETAPSD